MHHNHRWRIAAAAISGLALAGCSTTANEPQADPTESSSPGASDGSTGGGTVVLATHDSWFVPDETIAAFEKESGYTLEVVSSGDAGELTNKLVLTAGNPIADVVYGIDNTFASRAIEAGVLAPYTSSAAAPSAAEFALDGDGADQLTPIDWGDVCVNVDNAWFAEHDLAPPATLDDLAAPAYDNLFVTSAASTSSPGFAFLLATIGKYGEDGWQDFWADLMDNNTRVVAGWSDAYEVDFTAGGGGGDRPIVLSYASSPPFTIPQGETEPTTSALLDTCFRQVEYAGVLTDAANPEGAKALIDFLSSREFQEIVADNMYVFPVDTDAPLPKAWAEWAKTADAPIEVSPADIDAHRDEWIRDWSDLTSG